MPCTRCVERGLGHACERETVQLTSRNWRYADELRFLKKTAARFSSGPALIPRSSVLRLIGDRIDSLETGISPDENRQIASLDDDVASPVGIQRPSSEPASFDDISNDGLSLPSVTEPDISQSTITIEDVAWGRQSKRLLATNKCDIALPPLAPKLSFIPEQDWNMPTETQARLLVNFHTEYVCWHHNAIYSPDFLEACELFWKRGDVHHPLWLALYLAILSVS